MSSTHVLKDKPSTVTKENTRHNCFQRKDRERDCGSQGTAVGKRGGRPYNCAEHLLCGYPHKIRWAKGPRRVGELLPKATAPLPAIHWQQTVVNKL